MKYVFSWVLIAFAKLRKNVCYCNVRKVKSRLKHRNSDSKQWKIAWSKYCEERSANKSNVQNLLLEHILPCNSHLHPCVNNQSCCVTDDSWLQLTESTRSCCRSSGICTIIFYVLQYVYKWSIETRFPMRASRRCRSCRLSNMRLDTFVSRIIFCRKIRNEKILACLPSAEDHQISPWNLVNFLHNSLLA